MKKVNFAIAGAALAVSSSVAAFTASPMLVFIQAGNNVQDITISNPDADTAYVAVTPTLIKDPADAQSATVVYKQGMNPQDFGLMVSPLKLAVPATSDRKVRLVNLNANPKQDVYYTLSVLNVHSPMAAPTEEKTAVSDFGLNYGYTLKVMVLPTKPLPVVSAKRSGSTVTLANTGNSYISLRNGMLCNTSGSSCAPLPEGSNYHVLYAGSTWKIETSKPGVVKFSGVYGNQSQTMPVQSN